MVVGVDEDGHPGDAEGFAVGLGGAEQVGEGVGAALGGAAFVVGSGAGHQFGQGVGQAFAGDGVEVAVEAVVAAG